MDIFIQIAMGFAFLTAFIFAVLMVLLVAINYAIFLFGQRDNPGVFANALKFVFIKNQKESISPYKVLKISSGLSLIIFVVIVLVKFTKGFI